MVLSTILLVVAAVLLFIASFSGWYGVPANQPARPFYSRVNFIALGLFFWVLSILLGGAHLAVR
jgi:hypothetical protein